MNTNDVKAIGEVAVTVGKLLAEAQKCLEASNKIILEGAKYAIEQSKELYKIQIDDNNKKRSDLYDAIIKGELSNEDKDRVQDMIEKIDEKNVILLEKFNEGCVKINREANNSVEKNNNKLLDWILVALTGGAWGFKMLADKNKQKKRDAIDAKVENVNKVIENK